MRNVLESRISLNVLQSALSENIGRCQEYLDCYLVALRIESVIDPALFSCLQDPCYLFQLSDVENLQDCQKRPFVEDFFESLKVFA